MEKPPYQSLYLEAAKKITMQMNSLHEQITADKDMLLTLETQRFELIQKIVRLTEECETLEADCKRGDIDTQRLTVLREQLYEAKKNLTTTRQNLESVAKLIQKVHDEILDCTLRFTDLDEERLDILGNEGMGRRMLDELPEKPKH